MAVKTSADIQIENKSYTNKDFSQIYPELLDLVKKLTNKWDPETTNESDPGLVLLKLLAFIADKNNYNIDKNILEQFMPSVTQEENMRKLCDMMGYNVGYYRSATTDISFTYLGGNDTLDNILGLNKEETSTGTQSSDSTQFHLKAFGTSFKTEDNIVYTLLEDIQITDSVLTDTKRAIQGQIKALNLNQGSTTSSEATKIQLYNLDENNRIYIPDIMVAENGIFINKEVYDEILNDDAWRRVDNLNDQELGSKVFKFGFDSSKNLPYIEFPTDIADLIGDGLEIYYIVSDGVEGNVSPNTITSFNTYEFDVSGVSDIDDSCYSLTNVTSNSASEPETIDEAYKNFRKTVGTFNTLVSCKDYSNYIYTYQDEITNKHVVSNVQALDLRTDPNRSINLFHRDLDGITYYETQLKDKDYYASINDIILHATTPNNYTITNKQGYEQTYTLLSDSEVNDIENDLENVKTISHFLTVPNDSDISFIEERYALNINISTKYKVNVFEQSSILSNVTKALYNNFNAREVEFGEEIPYDEIVSVIENADERIKLVVVDDPVISPYVITGTSNNKKAALFNPTDVSHRKIIVENILGGRIQLYIKDESLLFDYDMDMNSLKKYDHLAAIKTSLALTIPEKDTDNSKKCTLRKNESIQIVEDSYISTVTYPAYVYYGFDKNKDPNNPLKTSDGVPYKLGENQTLYIYYTDTNNSKITQPYETGIIIRTNGFGLDTSKTQGIGGENSAASRWYDTKTKDVVSENNNNNPDYIPLYALGTNETIEILKLNETVLDGLRQRCYWYTRPTIGTNDIENQEDNRLIFYKDSSDGSYYHILEEDELFVYPSADNMALFSVGSGTKLKVTIQDINKPDPFTKPDDQGNIYLVQNNTEYNNGKKSIDLDQLQEAINSQDVNNFENAFDWNYHDFKSNPLHIVETTLTTYIEGDSLSMGGTTSLDIDSNWKSISDTAFSISVGEKVIGNITNSKIRTVLSFTGSAYQPQQIENVDDISGTSGEKHTQSIDLYYYNSDWLTDGYYDSGKQGVGEVNRWEKVSIQPNYYIQVNATINNYNDIILRSPYYEESDVSASLQFDGKYEVPYSAIVYGILPETEVDKPKDIHELIGTLDAEASATRGEYTFKWKDLYGMMNPNSTEGAPTNITTLTINGPTGISNLYINVFDQITGQTHLTQIDDNGDFNFDFNYIKTGGAIEGDERNVLISKPILLNINPILESQLKDSVNDIVTEIKTNQTTFDYLGDLSASKLIDSYDLVNSFFDYNNVYNPLTIAKIDFSKDKFNCNIVASSRK